MDAWIYRGGQTVWDDEHRPIRLEYYRKEKSGTCAPERVSTGSGWNSTGKSAGGQATRRRQRRPCPIPAARWPGLIEKLRRLSVTPTGLLEAVDDEVGEWV